MRHPPPCAAEPQDVNPDGPIRGASLFAPLPVIEKGWSCISFDPPLHFVSWGPGGQGRAPSGHYKTHPIETLATLPVQAVLARHAWGFFWSSGAPFDKTRALMPAWGFKYSSVGFVWFKLKRSNGAGPRFISTSDLESEFFFGLGKTTRQGVEFCLLGRRGRTKRLAKDVRQIICAPVREHSRKPDELYERVEQFCPGPRLDLFGRQSRVDWAVRGDERTKFDPAPSIRAAAEADELTRIAEVEERG
jgi:N6-adenosine-specific RNA methylase IME4